MTNHIERFHLSVSTAAMSKFNIFGADSAVPISLGTALSAPKMLNFDMAAVVRHFVVTTHIREWI